MTEDIRIRDFLRSLEPDGDPLCERIAADAAERGIPIVKRETGAFLKVLAAVGKPGAILEIGTAVGYSAILMALAAPEGCRITTIEKDAARAAEARENVRRAGIEERIAVICGDADEILGTLADETYDLVFMDAAKGQYIKWLPDALRVLRPGGILAADNVLQGGTVFESRFAVERRDRTIHARMREFLWELKHRDGLRSAVLTVGDGVAVAVKTGPAQ